MYHKFFRKRSIDRDALVRLFSHGEWDREALPLYVLFNNVSLESAETVWQILRDLSATKASVARFTKWPDLEHAPDRYFV